jgi:hypothetical protein
MAGVKGKSGGPRKNAGGARPGAGRKPKNKQQESANIPLTGGVGVSLEPQPHGGALKRSKAEPVVIEGDDTLKLLQDIAFGRVDATNIQVRAAIAAVQYTHTKRGDGGKKDEKNNKAKEVASRFAPAAPPKLVAAGGKKV